MLHQTLSSDSVINAARSFVGARFMHQGRMKDAMDCVGLIVVVAREHGLELNDRTDYRREPDGTVLEACLDNSLRRADSMEPGDVLLFWITAPHLPRHVAIWTGKTIIHSYFDVGRVVEHRLSKAWARRIIRPYRWRY